MSNNPQNWAEAMGGGGGGASWGEVLMLLCVLGFNVAWGFGWLDWLERWAGVADVGEAGRDGAGEGGGG